MLVNYFLYFRKKSNFFHYTKNPVNAFVYFGKKKEIFRKYLKNS